MSLQYVKSKSVVAANIIIVALRRSHLIGAKAAVMTRNGMIKDRIPPNGHRNGLPTQETLRVVQGMVALEVGLQNHI